jgi:hypothetical protein
MHRTCSTTNSAVRCAVWCSERRSRHREQRKRGYLILLLGFVTTSPVGTRDDGAVRKP